MGEVIGLRCVSCGRTYSPEEVLYTCPACGDRYGTLEVIYDFDMFKGFGSDPSMWRYLSLLPVKRRSVPLRVGWTPLYRAPYIAKAHGIKELYIKDDTVNPTSSYKDRASAIAIGVAREKGFRVISCASTGNAASSLAGLSASVGLKSIIFVPKDTPKPKLAQIFAYGAEVYRVDGSYDDAFDLCRKVSEIKGWYNRSTAINPYLLEGKKTGAFEIAEALSWRSPDRIFVPVGDGTIISAICKGFKELKEVGLVKEVPQIIGVQAKGAEFVKLSFERGEIVDGEAKTFADSICVGKPRDVVKAMKYLKELNGLMISVSDDEILSAIFELSTLTGIFAEPAAAASFAGFLKMSNEDAFSSDEEIVVLITGSGLKDVDAVFKASVDAPLVSRDPDKFLERYVEVVDFENSL